ncbi:MAG: hypothetical protein ACXABY_37185, partial [Candidatus Thorarchaeota archaeon]
MGLKRRSTKDIANEVAEEHITEVRRIDACWDRMYSTGSTQLDLAISGTRVRGGGIPGGIMVEIFGPPSTGKTALLAEIIAGAQLKGGEAMFGDPEGR